MTVTMFGIPNCDTIRKSRHWLDERQMAYTFHDYRKAGIDRATLFGWVARLGWEVVLNRMGTTFRKLPEAIRADVDADRAITLMLAQPSMIKRPIVAYPGGLLVGFKPDEWLRALAA